MVKPSSSSKHKLSRKASKFSALRRKLTLKKRNSPVQYNDTAEEVAQVSVAHAKGSDVFQRGSPMKLVRLYPKMSPDQVNLIKKFGYGGLVSITCSKLQPELCKYLMQCFNPVTCELVFPGRGKIPVTESAVYKVMGIANGDLEVQYVMDHDAISFMNEKMGHASNKQPSIGLLQKKLTSMKNADSNYLRLFLMYSMSSVLAPNTSTHVSPRLYPCLVNIKQAIRLNMCKFVITMLKKAAKSKTEKGRLRSCMLFFMVLYVDSLELQNMSVSQEGTRVSIWTNALIKEAILQDQRSDGTFGLAQLKRQFRCVTPPNDEFRCDPPPNDEDGLETEQNEPLLTNVYPEEKDEQHTQISLQEQDNDQDTEDVQQAEDPTILFSDPEILNRFMHMHVPSNSSPQDLVVYREAISEACYGFEVGLKHLIQKLSHRSRVNKRKNRDKKVKKQSAKRQKKKQRQEEAREHSVDIENSDAFDRDYVCEVEEEETRTPVSFVHELMELSIHDQQTNADDYKQQHADVNASEGFNSVDDNSVENITSKIVQEPISANEEQLHVTLENSDQSEAAVSVSVQVTEGQTTNSEQNIACNPAKTTQPPNTVVDHTESVQEEEKLQHVIHQAHTESDHSNLPEMLQVCETTSVSSTGHRAIIQSILDFVRIEPARKKMLNQEMFLMEPPELSLLDQLHRPTRDFSPVKMITEPSVQGLPNLIHECSREEIDKLVSDLIIGHVNVSQKKFTSTCMETKIVNKSPDKVAPSPTRYKTRSNSLEEKTNETAATPNPKRKPMPIAQSALQTTPRRLTRSTAKMVEWSTEEHLSAKQTTVHKTTTATVPNSAALDSMNRRLNFDSTDSGKQRRINLAPDPPSFDLGFETEIKPKVVMGDGSTRSLTSADLNEQENYSDESTQAASITPVANEYQKRVLKNAKFQRYPYIDYDKKKIFTVSKPVNELYNLVCMHGRNSGSETKDKIVIDVGTFFVHLADLADSVAPGEKLLNTVCEIGIHIISAENKNHMKLIMPLRISNYLIDCRFSLGELKKFFTCGETNRLDHKELICFPTLQGGGGVKDASSGHYFLLNLNIKARRFEILDSITTRNGESAMMDSCHLLIASIKRMWKKGYKASSIDISKFPIEVIPSPQQTNGYDCGFFMLKNLEEWNGRRLLQWYDQEDLPNLRKILNDKWIRFAGNKAKWQLIV